MVRSLPSSLATTFAGVPVGIGGGVAVRIGVADGILIAVDHADNRLGVGGGGVGAGQTLEGVLKVLRSQVGAVAPLQAVAQVEGPGAEDQSSLTSQLSA